MISPERDRSSPRRFLLSTFGTAGDILPFARLAHALLARGHHVTIHSWAQFEMWFPAGAAFVAAAGGITVAEVDHNFEYALRAPSFVEQVRRFARLFYGLGDGSARGRAYYTNAVESFGSHDLALIHTLDHVGQAAAETIGLPWLCYASRPPPDPAVADVMYAAVDNELGTLLTEITGTTRHVRMFREESPIRTLAACSPELVGEPPPRVHITGAWFDAPRPQPIAAEIEDFLAVGPALLVTFGTMPDVNGRTAALFAAVKRSGWRAIVQILSPERPPDVVPEEILVVRDRLPFATLFPRVAAIVHHGSVGTVHEALRAGRPSLVLPHMGDQFYWAQLLRARDLAPPQIRAAEIHADALLPSLLALHQPEFTLRTAEIGPRIAAENGIARAVAEMEEVG